MVRTRPKKGWTGATEIRSVHVGEARWGFGCNTLETALPVSMVLPALFQLAATHARIPVAGVLSMKGVDENARNANGDLEPQPYCRQPTGAGSPAFPIEMQFPTPAPQEGQVVWEQTQGGCLRKAAS